MANYIIPVLFITIFVYALLKKIPLYTCFTDGIKSALRLVADIFPFIAAIFIAVELRRLLYRKMWLDYRRRGRNYFLHNSRIFFYHKNNKIEVCNTCLLDKHNYRCNSRMPTLQSALNL